MTRRKRVWTGTISCKACGTTTPRRGPKQSYCPPCSAAKQAETQRNWMRRHRPSRAVEKRKRERQITSQIVRGAHNSLPPSGPDWMNDYPVPAFVRYMQVSIPYDQNWSKNAMWRFGGRGHVYVRQDVGALRDSLAWTIRSLMTEPWPKARTWLDILVEKPNHRSDATNVVDTVCDAVQDGLRVPDNWFSIRRLEWLIVKFNGQIHIGIGQASVGEERVCHRCGRVFDRSLNFQGNGRVCATCRNKKGEAIFPVTQEQDMDGLISTVIDGLVGTVLQDDRQVVALQAAIRAW